MMGQGFIRSSALKSTLKTRGPVSMWEDPCCFFLTGKILAKQIVTVFVESGIGQ